MAVLAVGRRGAARCATRVIRTCTPSVRLAGVCAGLPATAGARTTATTLNLSAAISPGGLPLTVDASNGGSASAGRAGPSRDETGRRRVRGDRRIPERDERARRDALTTRWPLGASFRRSCVEHIAKNGFVTLDGRSRRGRSGSESCRADAGGAVRSRVRASANVSSWTLTPKSTCVIVTSSSSRNLTSHQRRSES